MHAQLDELVKNQSLRFVELFRNLALSKEPVMSNRVLEKIVTDENAERIRMLDEKDAFSVVLRKFLTLEQIAMLPSGLPRSDLLDLGRSKDPNEVYVSACNQLCVVPLSPAPNITPSQTLIPSNLSPVSPHLLACAAALHALGGTDSLTIEGLAYPDAAVAQVIRASSGDIRKPKRVVIKDCSFGPLCASALFEYHADPSASRIEDLEICNAAAAVEAERVSGVVGEFIKEEFKFLTESKIPAICPVLVFVRFSSTLRSLRVAGNFLSVAATQVVGWAIQSECRLQTLDLSRTGLDNVSLAPIIAGLAQNNSLTELLLSGNENITNASELINVLAKHSRIAHLDLCGIHFDTVDSIIMLLRSSYSLQALHVQSLDNSTSVVTGLWQLLRSDTSMPSELDDSAQVVVWRVAGLIEDWRLSIPGVVPWRVDEMMERCWVCEKMGRHDFFIPHKDKSVDLVINGRVIPMLPSGNGFSRTLMVHAGRVSFSFRASDGSNIQVSELSVVAEVVGGKRGDTRYLAVQADVSDECFAADISGLSFRSICSASDEHSIRTVLSNHYSSLHDMFVIFSARMGTFPFMTQVDLPKFFQATGLLFDVTTLPQSVPRAYQASLQQSDIVQVVTQTLTRATSRPHVAEKFANEQQRLIAEMSRLRQVTKVASAQQQITRSNFIEIICRVAVFVYSKLQLVPGIPEQLEFLCERVFKQQIIRPCFRGFSSATFADPVAQAAITRVAPAIVDERSFFGQIFIKYSVSIESFQKMTRLLRLQSKGFLEEDASGIFALSKQQQPDGKCERLRLNYEEFIQAFSRLSLVYEMQRSNDKTNKCNAVDLGKAFDKFFDYAVPKLKESLSH